MSKTIYVVMGNDYPDAVFSTEDAAKAYCKLKDTAERRMVEQGYRHQRIYWRTYDFVLDAGYAFLEGRQQ